MPIITSFAFAHPHTGTTAHIKTLAGADFLGPLRAFLGGQPKKKTWTGRGYNMIWRPNRNGLSGPSDRFLELNRTTETLDFTDISGSGVGNRGLLEPDRFLGALSYLQTVNDDILGPQHFEPGVWINVPSTTDPNVSPTVARMGSIPHGTTINAQGVALDSPTGVPIFTPANIVPFTQGQSDDLTALQDQPENTTNITTDMPSRTHLSQVADLDQAHFLNPTLFLSDVTATQTLQATKVFIITTDPPLTLPPVNPPTVNPTVGGGTDNIEMLVGTANGPNANAIRMTAIFWLEQIVGAGSVTFTQLQYTQRVLLNFNGLSWPHISVATLT